MPGFLSTNPRKLIAASALAIVVAGGGVAASFVDTQPATAQANAQTGIPYSFADLVDAVSPAVVSIRVSTEIPAQVRRQGQGFSFPDLPEDHPLRRFFDQFENDFGGRPGGQPQPRIMEAMGSGFLISADGYVVTNNHVVEGASEVTVLLEDETELSAEVIGLDPRTDLALLKINEDRDDLPFVEFADTEARVGDWVVAVGNPFGLGGTVTAGIISARGRDIGASAYDDFLQIDAAVNRGNSGGPAFNLEGDVVGVNTAIFSPNGGNVGIAFAIPANIVQSVIEDLRDDGIVTRGFLGVTLQDLNRELADGLGLSSTRGALVAQPVPGAAAEAAGVEAGDVITTVDGNAVATARDLSRMISQIAPGTDVDLGIVRNGEEITVTVTLDRLEDDQPAAPTEQQAPDEPETFETSSIGISATPAPDGGLLVEGVESDSPAAERGLMPGDVILQADGTSVSSVAELESAIAAVRDSDRSTLVIQADRGGSVRYIAIPLE